MTEAKAKNMSGRAAAGAFMREIGSPVLVLFLVGLVVTALLAWVFQMTNPIIEARKAADLAASLSTVLPRADAFSPVLSAEELREGGLDVPAAVTDIYPGTSGGVGAGFAVAVSPKGYGGAISMLVGVSPEGYVTGVTILAMNETPGLGTNAANPSFLSQYENLTAQDKPAVVKTATGRAGDIQALTGATVTSRAVTRGIEEALATAGLLRERKG